MKEIKKNKKEKVIDKGGSKMLSRVIILFLGLIMTCMMYIGPTQVQAQQQLACDQTGNPIGFLRIPRIDEGTADPMAVGADFSASVIQTFEASNGITGGTDNAVEIVTDPYNTLTAAYQVVTHWRVEDGFNSYVTVINNSDIADDMDPDTPEPNLSVHIHILDENCVEIVNFCDTYTPNDSHTYDLSNIVTDAGQPVGGVGGEGIMTITPAMNCDVGNTELGPQVAAQSDVQLSADVNIVSADVDLGAGTFMREDVLGPTDLAGALGAGDVGSPGLIIAEYNSQQAEAAGDFIVLNFADIFETDPQTGTNNYRPFPANSIYGEIRDYDDEEIFESCGQFVACYARVGINTELEGSDDFDPVPEENCAAEGDEDMDGDADCADSDCDGQMGPNGETCEPGGEMSCDDGQDNDGDGATDCADPSCDAVQGAGCEGDTDGDCSDGMDNDGDGNTDCADGGCDGQTGPNGETCEAGAEVTCDDGDDNDGDGAADCDDADCAATEACTGGGGGGGGGCTVVSGTTASTAAVNFLLPLLAVGFAFMLRRRSK